LCVGVLPLQQSDERGQASQWAVGAWTVGGNVPDAKIQLLSTAGAGVPTFSFGCGNGNGTSACDLGAVDASSAQREFQAQVTVPATATITAVSLMVTGSAANLTTDPAASASMLVLAPASPVAASLSPVSTIAPPGVAAPTATVSPGGSAANLFPSVSPGSPQAQGERPVANVSGLSGTPLGSEIAEIAGLAALGLAMVLAVARVSFRRPAPRHAADSGAAPPPLPRRKHQLSAAGSRADRVDPVVAKEDDLVD
jgi:hypothetical protein